MAVYLPRIAVIADSQARAVAIAEALLEGGYDLIATLPADRRLSGLCGAYRPDAWVVSLSDACDDDAVFDVIRDEVEGALLIDESPLVTAGPARHQWITRLLAKLENLVVSERVLAAPPIGPAVRLAPVAVTGPPRWASDVWVLGASLGGPEAVVSFLRELPRGLPVAFVYAQHIEPAALPVLVDVIARNTSMEVKALEHGMVLAHGQVGVVPVKGVCHLLSMGRVVVTAGAWMGPYTPSVDQLLGDLAQGYGDRSGAIIFSGLGDDGARGCYQVKRAGGALWVQSLATCVSGHMPEAVIRSGLVDKLAAPGELARALVERYTGMAA